eukprot:EG_transcript_19541
MSPPVAASQGPTGADSLLCPSAVHVTADPRYAATLDLATHCCGTSSAALLLLDDEQLRCRAAHNVDESIMAEVGQFCRRVLLCRESVVHSDDPLIPGCTFYAGTPILLPGQDVCLGVLVVLDCQPHASLPSEVVRPLELLAAQVAHLIAADLRINAEWRRMTLFIAKVSHELRTPLNGILGCAALLESQLDGSADAETAERLRHITASAEHNLQTVNQILDFAKLDAGRVELEQLTFDLRECVEEAMAMLPVDRKVPEVELGYEMAEDAEVVGDPHRLKQVLLNLLSNAMKFTTQGSVVLSVQLQHPMTNIDGMGGVHF